MVRNQTPSNLTRFYSKLEQRISSLKFPLNFPMASESSIVSMGVQGELTGHWLTRTWA